MADTVDAVGRRTMFPPQRQQEILRLARDNGQVDVADLASAFEVTTETIRRDLSDLQRRRLLRRVHGGAILWDEGRFEPLLADRDVQRVEEKRRIAAVAVGELPPEGVVLLDSGSTTARLAERIPVDSALTVITNSLVNAQLLADHDEVEVMVLGGAMDKNTRATADSQTVTAIQDLTVDTVVLGTDGVSVAKGLTTPYRVQADIKRAMIAAARRVILVADHSKVGNDQLVRFATCDQVDTLVTDTGVDDATASALEAAGMTVLRA